MNEDKKNEVVGQTNHNLSDIARDLGFDYRSNFDGGATPRLPNITIVHQGQVFKTAKETIKSFQGNILHYQRSNVLWLEKYDGGQGTPPDCASTDAIIPTQGEHKQSPTCSECPNNKWGSDSQDGKGKRCKNTIRCHILIDGGILPTRLTIPPTSLKPFDEFISGLYNEQIPYPLAKLEFSLVESSSGARSGFSRIVMKLLDIEGNEDRIKELKSYKERFKKNFGEEITTEEHA